MNDSEKINELKKAETQFTIHELIANRWSPRAFSPKDVEPEKLMRLFEAARWAPSAFNKQPWSYLVGKKGDDIYNKIFQSLSPFNQAWVLKAPILVLCLGDTLGPRGEFNRSFAYDCGQANALLSIQATHEGLFLHQMGGMDYEMISKSFEITENREAVVAFAIGYYGNFQELAESNQKMELTPRSRKKVEEFVTML